MVPLALDREEASELVVERVAPPQLGERHRKQLAGRGAHHRRVVARPPAVDDRLGAEGARRRRLGEPPRHRAAAVEEGDGAAEDKEQRIGERERAAAGQGLQSKRRAAEGEDDALEA